MIPPASRSSPLPMTRTPRPSATSSRMKASNSAVSSTRLPPSHKGVAQHLPERTAGDLVPELDQPGDLVVGEALLAVADELTLSAALVRDDHRLEQLLAFDRAGHPDDDDLAYLRINGQDVLDLDRVDLVVHHIA